MTKRKASLLEYMSPDRQLSLLGNQNQGLMKIGVTGHRMKRLPFHESENNRRLIKLSETVFPEKEGIHIISGMEWSGWDKYAALRACHLGAPLTAAVPYPSHAKLYAYFLGRQYPETEVVNVTRGNYSVEAMYARNKFIIDSSDVIYALWDGRPYGGTYYTVRRAESLGKTVINLWDEFTS